MKVVVIIAPAVVGTAVAVEAAAVMTKSPLTSQNPSSLAQWLSSSLLPRAASFQQFAFPTIIYSIPERTNAIGFRRV